MKKIIKNKIIVYQTRTGAIELKGDYKNETIWANLDQISYIFGRDKSVVSRHIKNIFTEKELIRSSVVAFFATTAGDGKTYKVEYFNLDLILSVGYRVNSKKATLFRQWATKTLREHITRGYTINKNRIVKNYEGFLVAVEDIKSLLPSNSAVDTGGVLELVKMFASTWLSLDAYDRSDFPTTGVTKKQVRFSIKDLNESLSKLKVEVNSNIFGVEKNTGNVASIVGNIFQSFDNQDVYPTIEEKAAHLLYFMVKNHPFIDGNKRSGAFSFVWFLKKAGVLDTSRISPEALTALTLLVAESSPKNKDKVIGLILQFLKK